MKTLRTMVLERTVLDSPLARVAAAALAVACTACPCLALTGYETPSKAATGTNFNADGGAGVSQGKVYKRDPTFNKWSE